MVIYDSSTIYIDSATSLLDKIASIDAVIDALFTAAANGALTGDVSEYWLDDGQTKIKEVYRSPESILGAIKVFEMQRQTYINRFNGRKFRLVDSRSFKYRRYGR